eukprot:TRINITY_DN2219_c4_g1_i1.p1 TRINITY_DN2219_c4_g1~~TRINITY_DN2219_c4_g1_i1.p1  ORF type:complete len:104 (-),score=3.25 TRINITY_DN2219_c4_g1_i1:79-351(-)
MCGFKKKKKRKKKVRFKVKKKFGAWLSGRQCDHSYQKAHYRVGPSSSHLLLNPFFSFSFSFFFPLFPVFLSSGENGIDGNGGGGFFDDFK